MSDRMICPDCGVKMNFHAEKLVYPEPAPNPQAAIAVEEIHTCPNCGKAASRAAFDSV